MFLNLSTLQLTCQDTNARGEGEHESDHDSGEVDGTDCVEDDEHPLVIHVFDHMPAGWKQLIGDMRLCFPQSDSDSSYQSPTGKTHTRMCRSKKNENQGVG